MRYEQRLKRLEEQTGMHAPSWPELWTSDGTTLVNMRTGEEISEADLEGRPGFHRIYVMGSRLREPMP